MSTEQEPLTTDQLFSRTKQTRQLFISRQLSTAICAAIFGLLIFFHVLGSLETVFLDVWLSRAKVVKQTEMVLIPISGKSLNQIGKWPWPPFRHAVMIEFLQRLGARSIYIDHNFSESWWEEDQKALTAVLSKKKIPVFFAADFLPHFDNSGPGLNKLTSGQEPRMDWVRPLPEIAKMTLLGHRQLNLENDRVFRFWKPWFAGQGVIYPIAALKMLSEMQDSKSSVTELSHQEDQNLLIPWSRMRFEKWTRFEFSDMVQTYLSLREGMKQEIDPEIFKGKDIFIGLADESSSLSGRTPWNETVFPFEVMAMIFDGLRNPDWDLKRVAPAGISILLFIAAAAGLFFWTGQRLGRVYWFVWAGIVTCVILIWMTGILLSVWVSVVSTLLYLITAGAVVFVFDALHVRQERSALFHLATRDGLTNLYVIRHFRVIMNQMTREAVMRKESLAVILMDIDHFKKINDTHGHPAGDMVLKQTAQIIQAAVRQKRTLKDIDFVARYGGEEFIILIRRNSLESVADRIAERIRVSIQEAHYDWNGTKISVTTSLGVAMLNQGENIPDPMVHRADKALYLAKQSGRNRVCTQNDIKS